MAEGLLRLTIFSDGRVYNEWAQCVEHIGDSPERGAFCYAEDVDKAVSRLREEVKKIPEFTQDKCFCDGCKTEMKFCGSQGMDERSWTKYRCPKCGKIITVGVMLDCVNDVIPLRVFDSVFPIQKTKKKVKGE